MYICGTIYRLFDEFDTTGEGEVDFETFAVFMENGKLNYQLKQIKEDLITVGALCETTGKVNQKVSTLLLHVVNSNKYLFSLFFSKNILKK